MDALKAALAGYVTKTYADMRGAAHVLFRTDKGDKVVDVADAGGGTLRCVAYLDHGGDEGLQWVDSKTYKTAAGAARFAKGFLK